MIKTGKCPKCETTVSNVTVEEVTVDVVFAPTWRGVSYVCPHCRTVLGVQIDPVALKTDIVEEIISRLRE